MTESDQDQSTAFISAMAAISGTCSVMREYRKVQADVINVVKATERTAARLLPPVDKIPDMAHRINGWQDIHITRGPRRR